MEFTGERFIPGIQGRIELEHLHRYSMAKTLASGKNILDIASGEGYGSAMLAEVANRVIGVDISEEAVRHARNKYQLENLEFRHGSCSEIPVGNASIDLVVSFETIEHHGQHEEMLCEIKRVLLPQGILLISSPDKYSYSVLPNYSNRFHVKELFRDELEGLLGKYFRHYSIYGQRVIYGSGIFSSERGRSFQTFHKDKSGIITHSGMPKPIYEIALAADVELPALDNSVFEQKFEDSEIVSAWAQTVVDRDKRVAELSQAVADHDEQVIELARTVADRDKRVAELSQAVADHDEQVIELARTVAERDDQIARLTQALAERQGQIGNLKQALAGHEATITGILHSRSWKVTRPLRFIGRSFRKAMPNARRRFRLPRAFWIIRKSGLFDSKSYLERNPDVASFRWGPLWHYLLFGVTEGRDPHPLFCTTFYLQNNRDVAEAGVNPLFHYLRRGAAEGRDPHPLFDSSYYLSQNPDVARAGVNPLGHYLAHGAHEGRDPHPLFDTSYYLEQYPDAAKAGVNPLEHYLRYGGFEGRDPHPLFDSSYYLEQYPDVAKAGVNPLEHYLRYGGFEGRDPHPLFDSSYCLEQYPDVAKAGVNPLTHYLSYGGFEGRDPHPLFDSSYYLEQYPDVAKAGVNPLEHYLRYGGFEGRDPYPQFNSSYYLKQNPDVAEMRINPLVHYVGTGIAEGRDPNASFDTSAYLENNPEVALKGLNPLVHYLTNAPQFNLRAALRNEFQLSGRALLDSDHDSHPLVSVIIPCFNHGHFLEDAVLSSLLACSYPLEIIVVDDGSTDPRSIAITDELADKYKFTLFRQANTGLAGARNTGIQRARGKFIQFLDADDLLAPGKIDTQLDEFRSDPEIDICISEYELCNADGLDRRMMNPSTIDGYCLSKEDFLLRWERGLSIPIHCALFRRELLEMTRFHLITETGKEDWIFWVELSSRSPKFKFNPTVLATYRIHGRNMCSSHEGMGLDFLRASMYISQLGLGNCEDFLRASIQYFRTAYLGSIKHEAILWSRTHTEA